MNGIVVAEEKDFILDAFALLGGNENLVSQILERLEEMSYRWRRGTLMFNCIMHNVHCTAPRRRRLYARSPPASGPLRRPTSAWPRR